jgi:PilZ domain-containing protein
MGLEAVPVLEALRDDPDPHVRRQVQWALQKLAIRKGAPTQLRMETSFDEPEGKGATVRVPVTPMRPGLQRTQAVPVAPAKSAERRRQPRFRCERETFYRFDTDVAMDLWWKADICDVSRGGIGLVCTRQANPGAHVTIDLQEADAGVDHQAAAQVAYCRRARQGWHLGCSFVGCLVPEDLRQLRESTDSGPITNRS